MSESRVPPTLELLKRIMALPQGAATATQRLILTVYAYHANEAWAAWPNHATVAAESGLGRQSIVDNVRALAEAGLMRLVGTRPGGTRVWRMHLPEPAAQDPVPGSELAGHGCRPGRHPLSPTTTPPVAYDDTQPLIEPSIEPLSPLKARPGPGPGGRPLRKDDGGERDPQAQEPKASLAQSHGNRAANAEAAAKAIQLQLSGLPERELQRMIEPLDDGRRAELLGLLKCTFEAYGDQGGAVVAGLLRRLAGRDLHAIGNLAAYCRKPIQQVAAEVSREVVAQRHRDLEERQRLEAGKRAEEERMSQRQSEEADRAALARAFEALDPTARAQVISLAKARLGPFIRQHADRKGGDPLDGFLGMSVRDIMRERSRG